jgi:serine/threonine protein kinase/Tfp pilus assembly protein PilF
MTALVNGSAAVAPPDSASGLDDPRVVRAAQEYLAQAEAGGRPSLSEFVARYPDIAEPLGRCLAGLEFVQAAAPHLSQPLDGVAAPDGGGAVTGTLGDFRIIREVGRGGMGVVYEAEQLSLGRRVALKVLPFAATMDPRHLQRFHNEARAAAGLHHTNIVPVYGVGNERGVHYYAMQFIEGRTLADLIAEQRGAADSLVPPTAEAQAVPSATTVPPAAQATSTAPRDSASFRRVAEWGIQAAEALDCAHSLGVVHRDVKPANLLVDTIGRLWVTDFGLAQVQNDARLTMTGDLVGTLRYMSPEQALAKRVVIDHRTDVYSLGATLYELLVLRPAFDGSDRQELLRQIAFEEPRPPRRINRAIPAELETIVRKALEKNPQDRYATAQDLADDLNRFLEDRPIHARRPGLLQRVRKWARRHRPLVASLAAGMLILLVMAVVLALGYQRRLAETDRGVTAALVQVETLVEEGDKLIDHPERWQATARLAQAALEKADALLASGVATASLRERAETDRAAVDSAIAQSQLSITLNSIRLEKHTVRDGRKNDLKNTAASYAKAFANYGVDLAEPASVAARIRGSRCRDALVGALEEWWRSTADRQTHQQLDRVLQAVEPADATQASWWKAAREQDNAALVKLAEQLSTKCLPPAVICSRAGTLKHAKQWPAAERLLKEALLFHPGDFWLNADLAQGIFLQDPTRVDEAVAYQRAALACQGDNPKAHVVARIGAMLSDSSKLDEAIPYLKRAVEMDPGWATGHKILGITLERKNRLDEAIQSYQAAVDINPALPDVHYRLGIILTRQGKEDEAVACFERVLAVDPTFAVAYVNLGLARKHQGKPDEAIAFFSKAIDLDHGLAAAHCFLGQTLQDQGRFAEGLEELRRGDVLGRQRSDWRYPSSDWVREAEQYVALERNLPTLLSGEDQPADSAERLMLARMCLVHKKLYSAAARFFADAFADQPNLVRDLNTQNRYQAACAAALAGCGQGQDAGSLADEERARLRQQALDWLRGDLASYRSLLDKEPGKAAPLVRNRMQHWQKDQDFAGVRGPAALASLPEAERPAWQQLWSDVADTRAWAKGKGAEKKSPAK